MQNIDSINQRSDCTFCAIWSWSAMYSRHSNAVISNERVNSVPNNKKVDFSKIQSICRQQNILKFLLRRVKNIVGKKAGDHHFLLFYNAFRRCLLYGHFKSDCMVKGYNSYQTIKRLGCPYWKSFAENSKCDPTDKSCLWKGRYNWSINAENVF